jgi:hypothetical protein
MLFMAIELKRGRVNIGTQLRSAVAFGAKAVITIGSTKYGCHGSFGADSHIPVIHFFSWEECVIFARMMDCVFYGVSQLPCKGEKGGNIATHAYHKNAIFIINSVGQLSEQELSICEKVFSLILPDNGDEGAAHGNINYEGSIGVCLHYYTTLVPVAVERGFTGEKFNIEWTSDFSDASLDPNTATVVKQAKEQFELEHPNCNAVNDIDAEEEVLGGLFGFDDGDDDV